MSYHAVFSGFILWRWVRWSCWLPKWLSRTSYKRYDVASPQLETRYEKPPSLPPGIPRSTFISGFKSNTVHGNQWIGYMLRWTCNTQSCNTTQSPACLLSTSYLDKTRRVLTMCLNKAPVTRQIWMYKNEYVFLYRIVPILL